MSWFKACGDEECACCKKPATEGDEMFYDKVNDVTRCLPCNERELDNIIGKVDAEDSRFNTDYDN